MFSAMNFFTVPVCTAQALEQWRELFWVTESGCVWLSSSFVTHVFVLLTGVNKPTVSTELTTQQQKADFHYFLALTDKESFGILNIWPLRAYSPQEQAETALLMPSYNIISP